MKNEVGDRLCRGLRASSRPTIGSVHRRDRAVENAQSAEAMRLQTLDKHVTTRPSPHR
jgi:hypothetical protein